MECSPLFCNIFNIIRWKFSVLGGWGNSRVLIRKRIQNYSLKDIAISPVISDLRPLKVVIEIANGKFEFLFCSNDKEHYFFFCNWFQRVTLECLPTIRIHLWFRHTIQIHCKSSTWASLHSKEHPSNIYTTARPIKRPCSQAMQLEKKRRKLSRRIF